MIYGSRIVDIEQHLALLHLTLDLVAYWKQSEQGQSHIETDLEE